MLLKREVLSGIENGSISLAFRRWRRPTVRAGGSLITSIGQLAIEAIDIVDIGSITKSEAAAAGFSDLQTLRSQLTKHSEGLIYRIKFSLAGPDPRIALRAEIPDGKDLEHLLRRLRRLDSHSASGPWTFGVLTLISRRPAERAAELARELGTDRDSFKINVRKLKGLGLTESLTLGYRLSPRGCAVLTHLSDTHE